MNCSVCKSETKSVTVNGKEYCSVCGTPYATAPQSNAASRRSMDLAVRRPGEAAVAGVPRAAAQLHSRLKTTQGSRMLDLRAAKTNPSAATVIRPAGHIPAQAPKTAVHEKHTAHYDERLSRAKAHSRSPQIKKFSHLPEPDMSHVAVNSDDSSVPIIPSAPAASTPRQHHETAKTATINHPTPDTRTVSMPNHVATQHEAMAKLIHAAPDSGHAQAHRKPARRRPRLTPGASRVLATTAAVAIMAGYVWMQNYPKLTLQSASGKAGLTASLPGYVPSSYNLSRTDTKPGLVTLNFSSPSVPDPLKIAQARTNWDSSSLLDNYVAKHTSDYATVQGQGLTIYVFGDNKATWVNHGIWYSIEGAARLSREQVLKIAYSL